jgi:hypothetical protein
MNLLPLVPLLPVLMLLALIVPGARVAVMGALWIAPLPALLIAPLAMGTSLVLYPGGIKITLLLDAPGALLLGGAALLWSAAGVFARAQLGTGPAAQSFAAWWLLTRHPEAGDVFSWLDGAAILLWIGGFTLVVGGFVHLFVAVAARLGQPHRPLRRGGRSRAFGRRSPSPYGR